MDNFDAAQQAIDAHKEILKLKAELKERSNQSHLAQSSELVNAGIDLDVALETFMDDFEWGDVKSAKSLAEAATAVLQVIDDISDGRLSSN